MPGRTSVTVEAMTTTDRLAAKYGRIADQLEELYAKVTDPVSRMASAAAVLHAKMPHFFWTGFYRVVDGDLLVGPYQGPLACMLLARDKGVCWAAVKSGEPVLVPDVNAFAGHIACDARSKSEVAVPVRDNKGEVVAVLDVDSDELDSFGEADVEGLARIVGLIYA